MDDNTPNTLPTCLLSLSRDASRPELCGATAAYRAATEPQIPLCAQCAEWLERHGIKVEPL